MKRHILLDIGSVAAITLASQAISAIALLLLQTTDSHTADIYSLGIQTGNGAHSAIVLSVVYLLAIGRPDYNKWRPWSIIAGAFSIALAAGNCLLLLRAAESGDPSTIGVMSAFGIGGALQARSGIRATRAACLGRPMPLAAVTILPNIGLAIGVAIEWVRDVPEIALPLTPAAGWLAGAVAASILFRRLGLPHDRSLNSSVAAGASSARLQTAGLLIGATAGAVIPGLVVVATTQLPAGTTSILFLTTRLGTSIISLGLNSILLVKYNWTRSNSELTAFPAIALGLSVPLCATAWVLGHGPAPVTGYVLLVTGWALTLAATPFVSRDANFRRQGRPILEKSLLDAAIGLAAVTILWDSPTISGYFATFMLSQAVTCGVLSWRAANRTVAIISTAVFLVSGLVLLFGW